MIGLESTRLLKPWTKAVSPTNLRLDAALSSLKHRSSARFAGRPVRLTVIRPFATCPKTAAQEGLDQVGQTSRPNVVSSSADTHGSRTFGTREAAEQMLGHVDASCSRSGAVDFDPYRVSR